MSEKSIQEKIDMVREAKPSNIPYASGYSGVGRNPESNIKEAQVRRGLGRDPNSNIHQAKGQRGLSRSTNEVRDKRKVMEEFKDPSVQEEAAPSSCGNLRVFTKTVGTVTNVMVGPGQIGNTMIAEESMGSLNSLKGQNIYAHVTLNGTDGTYTAEVINGSTEETSDDTDYYWAIASISDTGTITQMTCGPIGVNVCRNWFAGTSPYYGLSFS